MIVSVTAPRKRMGQTTAAINLCLTVSKLISNKILLIDVNKYCKDIEYYLSNTYITKGLDDFYSMYKSDLLTKETFRSCVKEAYANFDIMSSNECFEFNSDDIVTLFEYVNSTYQFAVIDTISSSNSLTAEIVRNSDIVFVVINQAKNVVNCLIENINSYKNAKLFFVINRYSKDIRYDVGDIKKELCKAGLNNPIFILNEDVELINDCNGHSILNYIFNGAQRNSEYIKNMEAIARHIIGSDGTGVSLKKEETAGYRGLFKLLPVFGANCK